MSTNEWECLVISYMPVKYIELAVRQRILRTEQWVRNINNSKYQNVLNVLSTEPVLRIVNDVGFRIMQFHLLLDKDEL